MKMIDVAIPHFDDDPSPARPSISAARKPSTFARIRQQQDEEEYHLDHEKADEDEKEDEGAKDEFFDTEDMIDGVSSFPSTSTLTSS